MKAKNKTILLYCLALLPLLAALPLTGCFSVTEWLLGSSVKEIKKDGPGSVQFVQGPRYVPVVRAAPDCLGYQWWGQCSPPFTIYHYQYQYWPPRWWYQWWLDTGGRNWWLDYNYDPVYWPQPKSPRLKFTIERRTMIPRDTKGGIDRYVDHGVTTGSFLRAVLSNDLFEAVAKADYHNKLALAAICEYVYNYTPTTCHGSPEEVAAWIKFHREKPTEAYEAASRDRERRERYYDQESRK